MTAFVRQWVRRFVAPAAAPARRPAGVKLGCLPLEDRHMPAAFLSAGTLCVWGTAGNDSAQIDRTADAAGNYSYHVTLNGVVSTFPGSAITAGRVDFRGYGGDDRLVHNSSLNMTADGGAGNDTLLGGWANDTVTGGAGDDYLYTSGGNDSVSGGDGRDTITASTGNDTVSGGAGADVVYGDAGDDRLTGDAGNDWLDGGAGADWLDGGTDHDTVGGGDGNDTVYGWSGNDAVSGGAGDDRVQGEAGNDTVRGGAGNDAVGGGTGNDALYGDAGADALTDTSGTNTLDGGSGMDTLNGVTELQAALTRKGLTAADTAAVSTAVAAALRGPEARFLRFEGQSFHVKPLERSFDARGVTYAGRISHDVPGPDDQVDYRIRVENGQIVDLAWEIDDGGFSALVKPAASLAVTLAGLPIGYIQRVVAENVAELVVNRVENYVYGPWQNAARFLVEDIAAAARDQAAADIALHAVGGSAADLGNLQRAVDAALGGPTARFLRVFGHEFHSMPLTATRLSPTTVLYTGQLSHHRSVFADDQVHYSFRVTNGALDGEPTFRINQGGVTALVAPAVKVVDALVGVPLVGLVTFAAEELVGRIEAVADGSWESVARLMVQEIAASRARAG